ncbi:eight-cysteine-cluster domain-containing protein [Candidatus Woesearchaeota archaeon]|nr:eight-cysteine-cluster domain-containing protein [Candidatus Woesearchaeota archaeon]
MGLKIKRIIPILVLAIFLISCETPEETPKEKQQDKPAQTTNIECASDADCLTGGCSGQICGAKERVKGLITTCEWREEYACLRLTSCSCINNTCQWEENNNYGDCISNLK